MSEFHDMTQQDAKIIIATTTTANKKASQTTEHIHIVRDRHSNFNHENSLSSLLLEGCETMIVGIPLAGIAIPGTTMTNMFLQNVGIGSFR